MEAAFDAGIVADAVVAESVQQSRDFWNLREHIPLAQVEEGKNIKHDIAVPISRIGDFIASTDAQLQAAFPGVRMVTFGHLGDGNLHYNVSPPAGQDHDAFLAHQDAINRIVHDSVHAHGGSISAEHGLGQLKRKENRRYKSEVELAMMRAIKQALDPLGLMNPGKVV
jgi:FAD/FMN-containing dehydrogenase